MQARAAATNMDPHHGSGPAPDASKTLTPLLVSPQALGEDERIRIFVEEVSPALREVCCGGVL